MNTIIDNVRNVKKHNNKAFEELLILMNPAIKRYCHMLYNTDSEDAYQEFAFALWKSILELHFIENEGQIVTYLNNCLRYKYLELWRKQNSIKEAETAYPDEVLDAYATNNIYGIPEQVICSILLKNLLSHHHGRKRLIWQYISDGYNDSEIAKKIGVSRQYVHKLHQELKAAVKKSF